MTTNETSFYRDIHPWQTLRQENTLPRCPGTGRHAPAVDLVCSVLSGQEPYSLATLLKEDFPEQAATWDIRIAVTDLSESMVRRCKEGMFSQLL